ncbi:hypothetical protein CVIRNUC_007345 [Coccomyxa viridis]|uniref:RRM domain-containing protein n=1 Tax=Coccomyxa viridis TaxID=1274662 RepID=A0AAV1IAM2_9CHLO|nr:hypothetical protein CVIRNUC_007345 [Coccomyxa viridis]
MVKQTVETFSALALQITQGITYQRYLYLKKHETDSAKNTGLFVAGIPFFHQDTTAILKELFEGFGPVTDVALHPSKTTAIVILGNAATRQKVLDAADSKQLVQLRLQEPEHAYGLKGLVEDHKACFPGNAVLRKRLDDWTEAFEAEVERRRREAAGAQEEQGWTVVKRRGGGRKSSDGAGAAVGGVALAAAQATAAGKKEKTLTNFYRFQQKEKRRSELMDLREKFKEDKRRIAELKASRKFRPV